MGFAIAVYAALIHLVRRHSTCSTCRGQVTPQAFLLQPQETEVLHRRSRLEEFALRQPLTMLRHNLLMKVLPRLKVNLHTHLDKHHKVLRPPTRRRLREVDGRSQ